MRHIPWYRSTVFTVGMTAAAVQLSAMLEGDFIGALVSGKPGALAQLGGLVLTAIVVGARAMATVQPLALNKTRADAANAGAARQGGFARPLALALLLGSAVAVVPLMQGCAGSGTRAAYAEAGNVSEQAYVLAEQYAALVEQAANLRVKPTTPASAIVRLQKADQVAKPIVLKLKTVRDAYVAAKGAQTEAELQAAINNAVLVVAELVRAVQSARGGV